MCDLHVVLAKVYQCITLSTSDIYYPQIPLYSLFIEQHKQVKHQI